MRCPFCGKEDSRVIDSRPVEGTIRRRRVCEACDRRFTTYERVEMVPLMVIKKDEVREVFDRTKIERSIMRACHKRPVSMNRITELVDEIEAELIAGGQREIPTSVIGETVLRKLKDLDDVGYVRFASVYREFQDVKTFVEEIEKLERKK